MPTPTLKRATGHVLQYTGPGWTGCSGGGFLWTHHAQAQVYIDNKWKWVGMLGLSDSPTFSIANDEIYYREAGEYTAFLKTNNIYY